MVYDYKYLRFCSISNSICIWFCCALLFLFILWILVELGDIASLELEKRGDIWNVTLVTADDIQNSIIEYPKVSMKIVQTMLCSSNLGLWFHSHRWNHQRFTAMFQVKWKTTKLQHTHSLVYKSWGSHLYPDGISSRKYTRSFSAKLRLLT